MKEAYPISQITGLNGQYINQVISRASETRIEMHSEYRLDITMQDILYKHSPFHYLLPPTNTPH